MPRPRALCLVPHYFGVGQEFTGGSTSTASRNGRRRIVERTVAWLKRLSPLFDPTVLVYGMEGQVLHPIDVDVASRISSPHFIPWTVFEDIGKELDRYDYFLVVEDDILVPVSALRRMIAARRDLADNEILFPNRLELLHGLPVIPDLYFLPRWTGYVRAWRRRQWHEAVNAHSAFLFMDRAQMTKALEATDFSKPEILKGSYMYMDAAFFAAHRNFRLLRERAIVPRHFVFHQDSWSVRHKIRTWDAIRSHVSRYGRKELQWPGTPKDAAD